MTRVQAIHNERERQNKIKKEEKYEKPPVMHTF